MPKKNLLNPLKLIKNNTFKIIAGDFSGRKFTFIPTQELRPTAGKTRETLFNWIQFDSFNKTYLDCFAGSGALSFEALSRGAKKVVSIEKNHAQTQTLKTNAALFPPTKIKILQQNVFKITPAEMNGCFDFVFLDPPFYQGLVEKSCTWLTNNNFVDSGSKIYIESEYLINKAQISPLFTQKINIIKQKKSGQVHICLVQLL